MTDYIAKDYSTIRPVDEDSLIEIFKAFFKADKKTKIDLLEPGCGPGRLLKILNKISNLSLTGIDIRSDIVNIASEISADIKILHGNL